MENIGSEHNVVDIPYNTSCYDITVNIICQHRFPVAFGLRSDLYNSCEYAFQRRFKLVAVFQDNAHRAR